MFAAHESRSNTYTKEPVQTLERKMNSDGGWGVQVSGGMGAEGVREARGAVRDVWTPNGVEGILRWEAGQGRATSRPLAKASL